jgi:hypothetical protein
MQYKSYWFSDFFGLKKEDGENEERRESPNEIGN